MLNIHTEKIKPERQEGVFVNVSMVTEPEDKLYRISFFRRRRLGENSPSRSGINRGG